MERFDFERRIAPTSIVISRSLIHSLCIFSPTVRNGVQDTGHVSYTRPALNSEIEVESQESALFKKQLHQLYERRFSAISWFCYFHTLKREEGGMRGEYTTTAWTTTNPLRANLRTKDSIRYGTHCIVMPRNEPELDSERIRRNHRASDRALG